MTRTLLFMLMMFPAAIIAQTNIRYQALRNVQQGDTYLVYGNWSDALIAYGEAISVDPTLALAYIRRSSVHDALGDNMKATQDLNRAIDINPYAMMMMDARLYKKYLFFSYKPGEEVLNDPLFFSIEDEIRDSLEHASEHLRDGWQYYMNAQYMSAAREYELALEYESDNFHTWLLGSMVHVMLEDPDSALAAIERASEIREDPILFLIGAIAYKQKGDMESALEEYRKVLENSSDQHLAYYNMAYTQKLLGLYESAMETVNAYIDKNEDDSEGYNMRGCIHMIRRNYSNALDDFSRAISIDPENSQAYLNRAIGEFMIYQYNEGCQDANRALELGHPEASKVISGFCNY